jgi:hypothetical protein
MERKGRGRESDMVNEGSGWWFTSEWKRWRDIDRCIGRRSRAADAQQDGDLCVHIYSQNILE